MYALFRHGKHRVDLRHPKPGENEPEAGHLSPSDPARACIPDRNLHSYPRRYTQEHLLQEQRQERRRGGRPSTEERMSLSEYPGVTRFVSGAVRALGSHEWTEETDRSPSWSLCCDGETESRNQTGKREPCSLPEGDGRGVPGRKIGQSKRTRAGEMILNKALRMFLVEKVTSVQRLFGSKLRIS